MRQALTLLLLLPCALAPPSQAGEPRLFEPADVFELEWASDPRFSPDGEQVAYVRNSMDIMHDRARSEIWVLDFDGGNHRPLVTGDASYSSPRWSPSGDRLLYVAGEGGESQLYVRWTDTGQTARISHLRHGPRGVEWSPDGRWIAFAMATPADPGPKVEMPAKPEGAEWADPPKVIDRLIYRRDGAGYVEDGFDQLFLLPAEGGTSRQLTRDPFHHGAPISWTPDGKRLVFSANRREDWEYEPNDSEIWELSLEDGESLRALTDRRGPDDDPVVSPDGRHVAYVGFDDRYQGYQVADVYLLDRETGESRVLTAGLDRDVSALEWHDGGRGVFFNYTDHGDTKVALVDLEGTLHTVADNVGGLSLGRPYGGSDFDTHGDRVVFTQTMPDHPADLAAAQWLSRRPVVRLTNLNDDLLGQRDLAPVEEIRFASSYDGREIQGWIAKPPGFAPDTKYPLILEIHGGPFADYGPRFAAELQLYAAAGYVVLYVNPRGSSSYGEEFGNLIHHAYPSQDYDDLMSAVDAVIERGYVDPERLFVTGGSGGGVLTAWIVGKTDRFRAAVSAKPVINWTSFVFTADMANFFYRYWFPGMPWEHPEQYWARSPLSLAGNVTTPTMLLTGDADYRTPISESEQFYQALKLQRVETALVRVPGASHGIARRPSQLIAKVAHILGWFARFDVAQDGAASEDAAAAVEPVAMRFSDLFSNPAADPAAGSRAARPNREGERTRIDSSFSEAEILAFQAAARRLAPDPRIQGPGGRGVEFSLEANFDSIDISECCDSGTLNPPDPELAVGPDHIIAVVNSSLEIYDKSGSSLAGPTPFEVFYSGLPGPCTVFPFDPNVLYDEEADRFIVAADGDGVSYCVGVTQTGDPLGSYFFYEFPVDVNGAFFDYPHAGVGSEAIYVGANMFGPNGGRVFAFEKAAMYAGLAAQSANQDLGASGTPQPMNVRLPFPAAGPHYVLTSRGGTSNPSLFGLFSWADPFGADTLTDLGTLDTTAVHGISVGFPPSNPQMGGSDITGFNPRPLDFEYRDGFGWFTNVVGCNPGSGTRSCVQWGQVDVAGAALVDAGVFADETTWRYLPDLAVNACGDLAIGYSASNPTSFAGIRVAGRKAGDPAGTLQGELEVKAGERGFGGNDRWGDYTGMTSDPDGSTFWYLGEYAKDIPDVRNWGTFIGAISFPDCAAGIFADGFESGDTSAWSATEP